MFNNLLSVRKTKALIHCICQFRPRCRASDVERLPFMASRGLGYPGPHLPHSAAVETTGRVGWTTLESGGALPAARADAPSQVLAPPQPRSLPLEALTACADAARRCTRARRGPRRGDWGAR